MLRYVGETEATVWVEPDSPCEVELNDARTRTFHVEGHHYALVELTGLEPGSSFAYEVRLDGRRACPRREPRSRRVLSVPSRTTESCDSSSARAGCRFRTSPLRAPSLGRRARAGDRCPAHHGPRDARRRPRRLAARGAHAR